MAAKSLWKFRSTPASVHRVLFSDFTVSPGKNRILQEVDNQGSLTSAPYALTRDVQSESDNTCLEDPKLLKHGPLYLRSLGSSRWGLSLDSSKMVSRTRRHVSAEPRGDGAKRTAIKNTSFLVKRCDILPKSAPLRDIYDNFPRLP